MQPALDPAWTPITVGSVEGMPGAQVFAQASDCQQNGACVDPVTAVTEVAAQVLPEPMMLPVAGVEGESDLLEAPGSLAEPGLITEPGSIPEVDDLDWGLTDSSDVSSTIEAETEQVASAAEETISDVVTETADMIEPMMDFETVKKFY